MQNMYYEGLLLFRNNFNAKEGQTSQIINQLMFTGRAVNSEDIRVSGGVIGCLVAAVVVIALIVVACSLRYSQLIVCN